MSQTERLVSGSVRVLTAYGKAATAKHITEDLAQQLSAIADLLQRGRIEATLQSLHDKGYVSRFEDHSPPSLEPVPTDQPMSDLPIRPDVLVDDGGWPQPDADHQAAARDDEAAA